MTTVTLLASVFPSAIGTPNSRRSTYSLLAPLASLTGQGHTWLPSGLMRSIGPDTLGGFIHVLFRSCDIRGSLGQLSFRQDYAEPENVQRTEVGDRRQ